MRQESRFIDTANIEHNSSWYQELRLSGNNRLTDWIAGARRSTTALDDAAYAQLRRQSQDERVYTYGSLRDGLFADAFSQAVLQYTRR